jgi:unspecific monooxygenase
MVVGVADVRSTGAGPPPGPAVAPTVQALQWISRPYEFLQECSAQLGDVFTLDFGGQEKYVIFSHPDALRRIFTADASLLHVGPGNAVLEPLVGKASLLLLEEARHLRERRLLLPAFQPKTISRYGDLIRDAVITATARWTPGFEFEAQTILQDISIDVILTVIFGMNVTGACRQLKSELVGLLNDRRLSMGLLGRLRSDAPDPVLESFRARLQRLRELTKQIISDRRKSSVGGVNDDDVLAALLAARDEGGGSGSDDEIRDELLTLVVTGHETTATAMAWGLYWIASHGDVERRLRQELTDLGEAPEPGAVNQLPYLDATCKETLRIHPIVPSVFRQVVQPFNVSGYDFGPGIVLAPNIYLTHHREDLYPDHARFDPDRFLRRTYAPYEYLPFGGGVRRCIGMHLATYEMKIIFATLMERFRLELSPGQDVVPIRRMVAIAPSGGPRMTVRSA